MHEMRDHRCRRAAELAGAVDAEEVDYWASRTHLTQRARLRAAARRHQRRLIGAEFVALGECRAGANASYGLEPGLISEAASMMTTPTRRPESR
jgi:hypothetical protein